jgi:hypothetical protein
MDRECRQGGRGHALNTASGAKGGGARRLQALTHFGRKPIHGIEIERCGDSRLFLAFQKASLSLLPTQIRGVKGFGFQLGTNCRGELLQPWEGGFNPTCLDPWECQYFKY